jgi:phosphatidate phosphatase
VGLTSLLLYLLAEPFHRGFFCDDESIRYPLPESETISDLVAALVALGVPVFVVREAVSKYLHPRYIACFFNIKIYSG